MKITRDGLKEKLTEWVDEASQSSFEEVWAYIEKVFDIKDVNETDSIITRSNQLDHEIMHNHGQLPNICQSSISDKEKFDYIRLMAVIVNG